MQLREPTPVSDDAIRAIAARHGLDPTRIEKMAGPGIINSIYALGDVVLRIPHNHPEHVYQARVEAAVIPQARAAGVRTPNLIAFDESLDLLPVPYLVVERVRGTDIETLGTAMPQPWHDVGRDLALLHRGADASVIPENPNARAPDIYELVEHRTNDGTISTLEARWLTEWIEHLGDEPMQRVLTHGDVQMSNVLADRDEYVALLDWGCAGKREPVADMMPMPMRALLPLLDGYREIASAANLEARIVLIRLKMILIILPRGSAPGLAWGERPVAWLLDLMRFFNDPPDEWRAVRPPGRATT